MSFIEELDNYKNNKGYKEDQIISILSHVINDCVDKDISEKAIKMIHESVCGPHFNESFADKAVSKFYYINESDDKVFGPFITKDKAKEYYSDNTRNLTDVNFYDFYVALNKVISDHKKLLMEWFDDKDVTDKCVELTMSCLNDDDYTKKGCKIWNYINQDYL